MPITCSAAHGDLLCRPEPRTAPTRRPDHDQEDPLGVQISGTGSMPMWIAVGTARNPHHNLTRVPTGWGWAGSQPLGGRQCHEAGRDVSERWLVDCSWRQVSPDGAAAYTVDMSGDGAVHAHSVLPSGALSPINAQPSRGAGPCHLTVSTPAPAARSELPREIPESFYVWWQALDKFVLCANYAGGTICVLPVQPNGGLGPAVEYKDHGTTIGSGAGGHVRQDMAHPHQILLDPSRTRCFVPDLGTNKVHSYLWNPSTGALTEPNELMMHADCGPRHMCFTADSSHCFILGELDNSVTVCTHSAGILTITQTINALLPGTEHATAGGTSANDVSLELVFMYFFLTDSPQVELRSSSAPTIDSSTRPSAGPVLSSMTPTRQTSPSTPSHRLRLTAPALRCLPTRRLEVTCHGR